MLTFDLKFDPPDVGAGRVAGNALVDALVGPIHAVYHQHRRLQYRHTRIKDSGFY